MTDNDLVIMSLGGSIIVPDLPDIDFIREFRKLVLNHIEKGKRFIIITGGGKTCRNYQGAAKEVNKDLTKEDIDWIGIHSTRFNAEFMKFIFKAHAHPTIALDPRKKVEFSEDVLIGAGFEPGCSTDWDAVEIAKAYGANKLINLSNVKYVCDKDPRLCKDAKPIARMGWEEFRKIVGDEWDPGANLPFDPIAAKDAQEIGLEVAIMDGTDLANLDSYLSGKDFKGTVIKH